jgi:hypothetical protein
MPYETYDTDPALQGAGLDPAPYRDLVGIVKLGSKNANHPVRRAHDRAAAGRTGNRETAGVT